MIELDDYAHKILDQGQTTISNYLLKHYREIGISNQELFIYLLIKKIMIWSFPCLKWLNWRTRPDTMSNSYSRYFIS